MRTLRFNLPLGEAQKVNQPVRVAVSEPEADRGPRAGSPRGVVEATGSISRLMTVWRQTYFYRSLTRSLPLPVLIPRALPHSLFKALFSALVVTIAGLVSVVSAQSVEWETLRPEAEEFTVEMPKGSIAQTGKEPYHKMELNTRYYLLQAPNGPVFAVASFSGIKSNPALYTEMQRFNSYVDAFKTLFPPRLSGKITPVKLTLNGEKNLYGHPGREYRMSIGDASGTVQTFVTRRRFYAVVYLNPKKDEAVKQQFLSSFVLPQRMDQPTATATPAPQTPAVAATTGDTPNAGDANGRENPPNSNTAKAGDKPGEQEGGDARKGRSVAGGVLNSKALSLPKPDYPAEAKTAGVGGAVAIQVTVDETGSVSEAKAVSGHPLLQPVSVNAALQAKFAPTSLMGEPVKVTGVLIFNFPKP
ncbi:MAG TPA: energy transducer TonB [Pyrinomonadaceae bacterium]|nr:energy transducer TonB [Pyrinomonadaceae bacterium]